MKKIVALLVLIATLTFFGLKAGYIKISQLQKYVPPVPSLLVSPPEKVVVVSEESVITKVVKNSLLSVVTVSISTSRQSPNTVELNPFDPFSPFSISPGAPQKIEQKI